MNKSDSQMNKFIKDYLKVMMQRRSNYAVTSETLLSDKKLIDFITECFNNAPSSFNFKTQRMAILFGNYHHKLGEITSDDLPEQARERVKMFDQAYATILFYMDTNVVNQLAKKYPQYKDNFNTGETQANAMLQFQIGTGLCNLGYGVNIQHYNPLIDKEVAREFGIPSSGTLISQMPIGKSTGVFPVLEPYSKDIKIIVKK